MLEFPSPVSHEVRQVALGLYQRLFKACLFGHPSSLLKERLGPRGIGLLVEGEDRQVVEGYHLEPRLPHLSGEIEHRFVGRSGLLPLTRQLVRPAQLDVQMLEVGDRRFDQLPSAAGSYFFSCQKVSRPFVVLDGILCGEHFHRRVAGRHRIPEGLLCQTSRQSVTRQLCSRGTPLLLEHLKGPAVQHPPPCLPPLGVGYLPYLLVRERVGGPGVEERLLLLFFSTAGFL